MLLEALCKVRFAYRYPERCLGDALVLGRNRVQQVSVNDRVFDVAREVMQATVNFRLKNNIFII